MIDPKAIRDSLLALVVISALLGVAVWHGCAYLARHVQIGWRP